MKEIILICFDCCHIRFLYLSVRSLHSFGKKKNFRFWRLDKKNALHSFFVYLGVKLVKNWLGQFYGKENLCAEWNKAIKLGGSLQKQDSENAKLKLIWFPGVNCSDIQDSPLHVDRELRRWSLRRPSSYVSRTSRGLNLK